MDCPKCHSPQREDAAFCYVCGARLNAGAAAPPAVDRMPASPAASLPWSYGGFVARYVGIIVFGVLFLAILLFGMLARNAYMLFHPNTMLSLLQQLSIYGTAAVGMTVAGRAGGFDLSIAGCMGLSGAVIAMFAAQQLLVVGIVVALFACLIFGFLNGVFTVILKIPSVFVTLCTLLLARYVSLFILQGKILPVRMGIDPMLLNPLLFFVALAGGFLFIFFTKLGKPFPQREKGGGINILYLLAYVFSSLLAFMAGLMLVLRVRAAAPTSANGYEFQLLLLLLIAGSSTLWDNRVAPVIATFVACFFITLLQLVSNLLGFDVYYQYLFIAAFLLLALALDRVYRRNVFPFRPLDSKG